MGVNLNDCLVRGSISFTLSRFNIERCEDECKTRLVMNIPGISSDKVTVGTKWRNYDKRLYLTVTIDEGEDEYKEDYYIDTKMYDKYSWEVKDGRLIVTLYEIINEQPKFELVTEEK